MRKLIGSLVGVLALATGLAGCKGDSSPVAPRNTGRTPAAAALTMGVGSKSTLLARSTFTGAHHAPFMVKRNSGDWQVDVISRPALDVAVQRIHFDPGAVSGWHRHPGPAFIQVVYGTMTFYESSDPTCTPIVRKAGESYLDLGDDAHIARNETSDSVVNVVTYFAPPGAALRIDAPTPGNCPF